MDYCDTEWFALETNRDHSVVFEITSKYCISDSFVDHDGYSLSSKEQASFNFMAAVICSDCGAQENSLLLFLLFPHLFAMK